MRKLSMVAGIILALLFSGVAVSVTPTNADNSIYPIYSFVKPPVITIFSPENKTYASENITVFFNVRRGDLINETRWQEVADQYDRYPIELVHVSCSIDGNESILYNGMRNRYIFNKDFSLNITGLTEGSHTLKLFAAEDIVIDLSSEVYSSDYNTSTSVTFIVAVPPSISVLTIENTTYPRRDLTLNFTIDKQVSQIDQSLDGAANVTISGNVTLAGLSVGQHSITVYASDLAGYVGASETIYFNVDVPEPFPTAMVIAVSVTALALVSIGLLVYFRKRKH